MLVQCSVTVSSICSQTTNAWPVVDITAPGARSLVSRPSLMTCGADQVPSPARRDTATRWSLLSLPVPPVLSLQAAIARPILLTATYCESVSLVVRRLGIDQLDTGSKTDHQTPMSVVPCPCQVAR